MFPKSLLILALPSVKSSRLIHKLIPIPYFYYNTNNCALNQRLRQRWNLATPNSSSRLVSLSPKEIPKINNSSAFLAPNPNLLFLFNSLTSFINIENKYCSKIVRGNDSRIDYIWNSNSNPKSYFLRNLSTNLLSEGTNNLWERTNNFHVVNLASIFNIIIYGVINFCVNKQIIKMALSVLLLCLIRKNGPSMPRAQTALTCHRK